MSMYARKGKRWISAVPWANIFAWSRWWSESNILFSGAERRDLRLVTIISGLGWYRH